MTRRERTFTDRSTAEQEFMLQNTWCDACSQADLGMHDPRECEEDGIVFIEGRCRVCGSKVKSEIKEHEGKQ